MKVKELLVRREQLKGQKELILKSISEETAKMNKVDLEEFIRSGDAGKVDGFQLDKLQRKRKHLVLLGESLDGAIVQAQAIEKAKKIARLLREAEVLADKSQKLYEKKMHFLTKIQRMKEQGRLLRTEEDALRNEAKSRNRPTKEVYFKLNATEDFLEKQVILTAGEEKIRKEVLAARKHNKEVVFQPRIGINDKILRNVRIKWDCQTLAVLEFEIIEQGAATIISNLDRKDTLSKAEFVKEIT